MATYNTPYKSGTFNGTPASGATTFSITGFTPVASDVGRLIVVTSGNGRLQHREITAVSGQNITIAHAWDTNPFIDPTSDSRATDVLPENGDSFALSYNVDDLIASDAELTLTNNNHLKISSPSIDVSGEAYIHFKNYNIEFSSNQLNIFRGGGLIFGYYNYVAGEDGYMKDVCNIVDINGFADGMRAGTDSFGMLDIYGGTIHFTGNTFWRTYENSSNADDNQVRIIDVNTYGGCGGRVDGNRSMLILSCEGTNTNIGIFNPRSAVSRVEFTPLNCSQGGYVFTTEAPEGRAVFPRIVDVSSRLLRVFGSNPASQAIYEVIAKKSEVDQVPAFFNAASTLSNHIMRYGNLIRPTYIDASGSDISDNIKTRLYDNTAAFITENTITDGSYPEEFVRHTDVPTVWGNRTLANGTQYAPYSLRSISYGKVFTISTIDAEDTFDSAIVMLDDNLITESTKAVVDAYTELDTAQKLYDRAVSWLEANITDEEAFLVSRSGNEIDVGSYNVVVDATSVNVFAFDGSTITIKATTFMGSLKTTGVVTFSNGATVVGGIIDSTADSFLSFSGISSWIVYPTESDRDANTNASGSGTGSQTFRFNYVASTIYYLRLTTSAGETIFKQITPTQSGETNVSLETTSLLSSVNKSLGYTEPKIYVNTSLLINGDGSAASKFNNIDDAVQAFQQPNAGYKQIFLTSSPSNIATLSVNADNVIIEGTSENSYLNINGQSLQNSTIINCSIYGSQNLSNTITYYKDCAVRGDSDFVGKLHNCGFYGDGTNALTVAFHGSVELVECRSSNVQDTTFNFTNALGVISHDWKGGQHKIDNLTGSKLYTLYADRGECVINASSTGGFVTVNDMIVTTDNGTSTVLNSNTTEVKSDTIITDTNELQTNQGQWVTATGFATPTDVSNAQAAIITEVQQSETDVIAALPTPDQMTEAELHSALDSYSNKDDWKADVSSLSADVNVVEVNGVAITSINDFKADISNLALEATVNALNNLSSADITSAVPTTTQIATAVEAALIDEGDGQQLIDAILQVINSNLDLPALELTAIAQAVRTELTTELNDIILAKDHAAAANIQTKQV